MAKFKLALAVTSTENSATVMVSGADEWVRESVAHIARFVGEVLRAHGQDPENAAAITRELAKAHVRLADGKDFTGEFVTVRRSS